MSKVRSTLLTITLMTYASARTCCYYIEEQSSCEALLTSEGGPLCEWYCDTSALLLNDPISGREIHCRSVGWEKCQSATPPPECFAPKTPFLPMEEDCIDLLEEPLGSDSNSVLPGPPGDVADEIAASETAGCEISKAMTNCFGAAIGEAPNTLSFKSKVKNIDGDCCYTYNSIYTGATDCIGKKSEQSHITLNIDCDPSEFELTSNNEGYTTYGNDASTCYTGIKFDTGCDDGDCDYQVCIKFYEDIVNAECPLAAGWIMDTADNAFTFNSLEDGVPSCNIQEYSKNHYLGLHTVHLSAPSHLFMYIGAFAFVVLCFALWYWSRNTTKKSIKLTQTGYDTFSDQPRV